MKKIIVMLFITVSVTVYGQKDTLQNNRILLNYVILNNDILKKQNDSLQAKIIFITKGWKNESDWNNKVYDSLLKKYNSLLKNQEDRSLQRGTKR